MGRIPAPGAYVNASGFYAHGSEYLMLADPVVLYDSHLRRLASYPDGSRCAFADDGVYVLSGQGSLDYHPFDTSASGWHVHVDGSDSARASLFAMDDALIVSTGQTVTRWE